MNDLALFAKVDQANCSVIREVLYDFCSIFEQSVSGAKLRVYFSPNVDREARESLCDIVGFHCTPILENILVFL